MPDQPDATGRGRPDLGVDAEHPPHLGDEVGQRMREMGAQRGQLTAERDDPAVPGGGIRIGRPGIADRVGQAGRVGVGGGLRDDLLGGGVVPSAGRRVRRRVATARRCRGHPIATAAR